MAATPAAAVAIPAAVVTQAGEIPAPVAATPAVEAIPVLVATPALVQAEAIPAAVTRALVEAIPAPANKNSGSTKGIQAMATIATPATPLHKEAC